MIAEGLSTDVPTTDWMTNANFGVAKNLLKFAAFFEIFSQNFDGEGLLPIV